MSLALRYTWLLITTIIMTIGSLLIIFAKRYFTWAYTYNDSFLSVFGIESSYPPWIRSLFNWILGTGIATVILTVLVNLADSFLLLMGLSGIPLDSMMIPLIVCGILLSLLFIVAAIIPVLTMPLACPSALAIIVLVHLFGVPFNLHYLPSLVSTFLYFAAVAIGFVGVFLSIYMLFRNYIVAAFLRRFRAASRTMSASDVEEPES
jgi:hypothetical protein